MVSFTSRAKRKYVQRVLQHQATDTLIKGTGWEHGKGCAVGCTLHAYDHARYPLELGVPIELAYLEDAIFEGLSPQDARQWPVQFLRAIPPNTDLSGVFPAFVMWLLTL